jgi:serine O-acetyltransferase
MTVHLKVVNNFQLEATTTAEGNSFAFYLLHNGEKVEATSYSPDARHVFTLDRSGRYVVKAFADRGGSIKSEHSAPFSYEAFPDDPDLTRPAAYAVAGISKTSAFVAFVLSKRHKVVAFVDPTGRHVGETFFELPVLQLPPPDVIAIGHESLRQELPGLMTYTMERGSNDAFSRELHRHGALQLHRIAREAYSRGFRDGADFIQSFIYLKYNCRIPHKARIGDGTTLGYGGIGVVIHSGATIGRDCSIGQNVTIGGRSGGSGPPQIGDNVFISPGTKLLAGRVGSNVVIGANAVVLEDVPDDCVVAGVPARIISRDMRKYRGYTRRR